MRIPAAGVQTLDFDFKAIRENDCMHQSRNQVCDTNSNKFLIGIMIRTKKNMGALTNTGSLPPWSSFKLIHQNDSRLERRPWIYPTKPSSGCVDHRFKQEPEVALVCVSNRNVNFCSVEQDWQYRTPSKPKLSLSSGGSLVVQRKEERRTMNGNRTKGPPLPVSAFAGYGTVNRTPVLHGVKELIP